MAEIQASWTPFVVESRFSQFSARLEFWRVRAVLGDTVSFKSVGTSMD